MVYVSDRTHRRPKPLATQRGLAMGRVVAELVDREVADRSNSWLTPAGRALQQRALAEIWDDPDLDVYSDA